MVISGQTWRAFGQPIKRREDPKLITGSATYVDDITLPGMTYLVIIRSPHPHARIRAIHTDAASRAPGVVAVVTSAALVGSTPGPMPYDFDFGVFQDAKAPARRVRAAEKPRHVGDPVAAVLAETP